MLSHLIGAANRADIQRLTALEAGNAALLAKVGRQQQRIQDAVAARDATARRLASLAADAPAPAGPDDVVAALRHALADLQGRIAGEIGRRERLERRVVELSSAGQARERHLQDAEADRAVLRRELILLDQHHGSAANDPMPIRLPAQTVLYVGGRPGCVEQMRAMLEAEGGVLLCHDGGRHDHPSLLPGLIGQAEWVVFPVDCVSHDAALTVKRLCRRSGKRWSPLRSPGIASFLAAAAGASQHEPCCSHGACSHGASQPPAAS